MVDYWWAFFNMGKVAIKRKMTSDEKSQKRRAISEEPLAFSC
jgi:hypothetical protein